MWGAHDMVCGFRTIMREDLNETLTILTALRLSLDEGECMQYNDADPLFLAISEVDRLLRERLADVQAGTYDTQGRHNEHSEAVFEDIRSLSTNQKEGS